MSGAAQHLEVDLQRRGLLADQLQEGRRARPRPRRAPCAGRSAPCAGRSAPARRGSPAGTGTTGRRPWPRARRASSASRSSPSQVADPAGDLIARPAGQGIGQRRLARPVRPHDRVHLAGGQIEGRPLRMRLARRRETWRSFDGKHWIDVSLQRLQELEPVAEGVVDVDALVARQQRRRRRPRSPPPRARAARPATSSTRKAMCAFVAGQNGVSTPQVHLHPIALEPAPAALGELRRLRLLGQAQQVARRRPRLLLLAGRHGRPGRESMASSVIPRYPSSEIATSFWASTANSIGSSCSTSLTKPLTSSRTASSCESPRCMA